MSLGQFHFESKRITENETSPPDMHFTCLKFTCDEP